MIKGVDRQACEQRELAQSRSGYVVLVALALAPFLPGAFGFGMEVFSMRTGDILMAQAFKIFVV